MRTSSRKYIWPLLIVSSVFIVSGQSEIADPGFEFSVDKLAHFGVFGALATSLIRIPFFRVRRWKGAVHVFVLVSCWGGLDEFRQSFTPGRAVEFDDWLADTLGALVAVILYQGWPAYRSVLESRPLKFSRGRTTLDS